MVRGATGLVHAGASVDFERGAPSVDTECGERERVPLSSEFRRDHFTRMHRIEARVSQALDGLVYRQRHGLIRGLRRRGGLGFLPAFVSRKETEEERFLRGLELDGRVVFDVGAFQGHLSMFFASRGARVVSYEPNPSSRERLCENLRLNEFQAVEVRPCAVGASAGTVALTIDPLMPGASSAAFGDAMVDVPGAQVIDVPVVVLDDDIATHGLPLPDLIKIDVEGFELAALRGLTRTLARVRPELYLEMHGVTLDEKRERVHALVEFLFAHGYRDITHVESGSSIDPATTERAARGHLYCRATYS